MGDEDLGGSFLEKKYIANLSSEVYFSQSSLWFDALKFWVTSYNSVKTDAVTSSNSYIAEFYRQMFDDVCFGVFVSIRI